MIIGGDLVKLVNMVFYVSTQAPSRGEGKKCPKLVKTLTRDRQSITSLFEIYLNNLT